jgi:hypothetical protein
MLRVAGVLKDPAALCIVEIDPYVPISFRTRAPFGNVRYIRLGDFKSQLLELQFPRESLAVSGFTLVGGKCAVHGGLRGDGPSAAGLPVVSLAPGQAFSNGRIPLLDIHTSLELSSTGGRAEIRFGGAEIFNRTVVHDRVQFLIMDDILVGLGVLHLTDEERRVLDDFVGEH